MSVCLTQQDLERDLRSLGLKHGDVVEVHSSLSSLGWVCGGASVVVDTLMNIITQKGTILMAASALSPPLPLTAEEKARGIRTKVRLYGKGYEGKTGIGAIADEFRTRPETVLGPSAYTIAVWGNEAERHCRSWEYLLNVNGLVLLIGVDIHRCSCMHIAEERVGIPQEITQLSEIPQDILRDYPPTEWYIECGGPPDDAWGKIQTEAERRGLIKQSVIGAAKCSLFNARAVISIYEKALRTDPYQLFGVIQNGQDVCS